MGNFEESSFYNFCQGLKISSMNYVKKIELNPSNTHAVWYQEHIMRCPKGSFAYHTRCIHVHVAGHSFPTLWAACTLLMVLTLCTFTIQVQHGVQTEHPISWITLIPSQRVVPRMPAVQITSTNCCWALGISRSY